jgi:hypothetical protein
VASHLSTSLAERVRRPANILLAATAALPLVDLAALSWPMHPGLVAWRFSALGQLSSGVVVPLLAIVLLYALAFARLDTTMLRLGAVLAGIYALLLITAVFSFPLDALQMRRRVPDAAQSKFLMATVVASFRLLVYAIGSIVLTVSLTRAARVAASKNQAGPLDPASSLVMRQRDPARLTPLSTPAINARADVADAPRGVSPEE